MSIQPASFKPRSGSYAERESRRSVGRSRSNSFDPESFRPRHTSFVQLEAFGNVGDIFLVRGNDITGRKAWYYFKVRPTMKQPFEIDSRKGQIDLSVYGRIIYSGYGEEPTDDAKTDMEEIYGFHAE